MDVNALPFDPDTMLAGLREWVECESPTFDPIAVTLPLPPRLHLQPHPLFRDAETVFPHSAHGDVAECVSQLHPVAANAGNCKTPRS